MKYYQVVWWTSPADWVVGFKSLLYAQTSLALVYKWTLCLGPLEIRKMNNDENKFDLFTRSNPEG